MASQRLDEQKLIDDLLDISIHFAGNEYYEGLISPCSVPENVLMQHRLDMKPHFPTLQEMVSYFRVGIKYQAFDIEATKRENRRLRNQLEGTEIPVDRTKFKVEDYAGSAEPLQQLYDLTRLFEDPSGPIRYEDYAKKMKKAKIDPIKEMLDYIAVQIKYQSFDLEILRKENIHLKGLYKEKYGLPET